MDRVLMTQVRALVGLIYPHRLHLHGIAVYQVFQTRGKCLNSVAGHGLYRRSTGAELIGPLDRHLRKLTLTRREKRTVQADYRDQCLLAGNDHALKEALPYDLRELEVVQGNCHQYIFVVSA